MSSIGLITEINGVSDGDPPQMGSANSRPFQIDVQTTGGQKFFQISEDAAVKLKDLLSTRLSERGNT